MTETTAYYWRYNRAYAARFCEERDALAFLDHQSDANELAPDGLQPLPGVEYEDLGHDHCFGPDCPDEGGADG